MYNGVEYIMEVKCVDGAQGGFMSSRFYETSFG